MANIPKQLGDAQSYANTTATLELAGRDFGTITTFSLEDAINFPSWQVGLGHVLDASLPRNVGHCSFTVEMDATDFHIFSMFKKLFCNTPLYLAIRESKGTVWRYIIPSTLISTERTPPNFPVLISVAYAY